MSEDTGLRGILPLMRELNKKREELNEAFIAVNRVLRRDGYTLYWDDSEEHYSIYPLPQALDGTYFIQERSGGQQEQ